MVVLLAIAVALAGTLAAVLYKNLIVNRDNGGEDSEPVAAVTPAAEETVLPTASPAPTPTPVTEEYHLSMFLTGDALIHGALWYDAATADGSYDFRYQIASVKEVAEKYDLQYYNQETIIGGDELGPHGYPTFNTPSQWGDAMRDAGFNLVSKATNHSLDQGVYGINNSNAYWRQFPDVVTAGTNDTQEEYDALPIYEMNGITYAFMSYTYGTNGIEPPADQPYVVNYYPGHEEEILEKIRRADELADVVIMAMHWGTEYSHEVNEEQETFALQMSEAGADIIVGNHPHVIQPISWINNHKTICYYAMGNMISAQNDEQNLVGIISGLDITKRVTGEEKEIIIDNVRADLIWTKYRRLSENAVDSIRLYRFEELDDSILPNHDAIYEKYKAIMLSMDDSITVGGV